MSDLARVFDCQAIQLRAMQRVIAAVKALKSKIPIIDPSHLAGRDLPPVQRTGDHVPTQGLNEGTPFTGTVAARYGTAHQASSTWANAPGDVGIDPVDSELLQTTPNDHPDAVKLDENRRRMQEYYRQVEPPTVNDGKDCKGQKAKGDHIDVHDDHVQYSSVASGTSVDIPSEDPEALANALHQRVQQSHMFAYGEGAGMSGGSINQRPNAHPDRPDMAIGKDGLPYIRDLRTQKGIKSDDVPVGRQNIGQEIHQANQNPSRVQSGVSPQRRITYQDRPDSSGLVYRRYDSTSRDPNAPSEVGTLDGSTGDFVRANIDAHMYRGNPHQETSEEVDHATGPVSWHDQRDATMDKEDREFRAQVDREHEEQYGKGIKSDDVPVGRRTIAEEQAQARQNTGAGHGRDHHTYSDNPEQRLGLVVRSYSRNSRDPNAPHLVEDYGPDFSDEVRYHLDAERNAGLPNPGGQSGHSWRDARESTLAAEERQFRQQVDKEHEEQYGKGVKNIDPDDQEPDNPGTPHRPQQGDRVRDGVGDGTVHLDGGDVFVDYDDHDLYQIQRPDHMRDLKNDRVYDGPRRETRELVIPRQRAGSPGQPVSHHGGDADSNEVLYGKALHHTLTEQSKQLNDLVQMVKALQTKASPPRFVRAPVPQVPGHHISAYREDTGDDLILDTEGLTPLTEDERVDRSHEPIDDEFANDQVDIQVVDDYPHNCMKSTDPAWPHVGDVVRDNEYPDMTYTIVPNPYGNLHPYGDRGNDVQIPLDRMHLVDDTDSRPSHHDDGTASNYPQHSQKGRKAINPSYRDRMVGVYDERRRTGQTHQDALRGLHREALKIDNETTLNSGADPHTAMRSIDDVFDSRDEAERHVQNQYDNDPNPGKSQKAVRTDRVNTLMSNYLDAKQDTGSDETAQRAMRAAARGIRNYDYQMGVHGQGPYPGPEPYKPLMDATGTNMEDHARDYRNSQVHQEALGDAIDSYDHADQVTDDQYFGKGRKAAPRQQPQVGEQVSHPVWGGGEVTYGGERVSAVHLDGRPDGVNVYPQNVVIRDRNNNRFMHPSEYQGQNSLKAVRAGDELESHGAHPRTGEVRRVAGADIDDAAWNGQGFIPVRYEHAYEPEEYGTYEAQLRAATITEKGKAPGVKRQQGRKVIDKPTVDVSLHTYNTLLNSPGAEAADAAYDARNAYVASRGLSNQDRYQTNQRAVDIASAQLANQPVPEPRYEDSHAARVREQREAGHRNYGDGQKGRKVIDKPTLDATLDMYQKFPNAGGNDTEAANAAYDERNEYAASRGLSHRDRHQTVHRAIDIEEARLAKQPIPVPRYEDSHAARVREQREAGHQNYGESTKNLRGKYGGNSLRKRLRKSTPGVSLILVQPGDLDAVQKAAGERSLGIKVKAEGDMVKVQLTGDDTLADQIAQQYGRQWKNV